MKVELDIPYPEVKVEQKNTYYADVLSSDYAGKDSETTAVMTYSYQHFDKFNENELFAKTIEQISLVEMRHLEMLGKTIKLLGKDPVYSTCESTRGDCISWTSTYVNYETDLKEILKDNIKAEETAIKNYEHHKLIIDDNYIKTMLSRIILDEKRHIEIFKMLCDGLNK